MLHTKLGLGAAAVVSLAAGCVPLGDYRALEKRFQDQEQYVVQHKDQVRELERREQLVTLRASEQERQLELLRARLQKSETLRQRLEERGPATVPASAPAPARTTPEPTPATFMGLEVNPETKGVVLESGVLFPPGKAELRPEGKQVLDRLVGALNGPEHRGSAVRIDGHTDDQPIQRSKDKNQSNWDLSARRALAVVHYLEEKGIDAARMSFAGFGPHRPYVPGTDDKARSKNRRVEIVVTDR